MTLLDRVKVRTGSDLPDDELQAMLDGVASEMDALFGPAGQITVDLGDLDQPCMSYLRTLRLARPLDTAQPVTIIESEPGNSGASSVQTQIADADFRVLHSGRTLQRLTSGPNGRSFWAPLVTVTYVPIGEQAARDEAAIKLVHLDLSYRGGLKSERAGDYQFTLSGDPVADREAIFDSLKNRRGMVMA
jgi:hypothetical protein